MNAAHQPTEGSTQAVVENKISPIHGTGAFARVAIVDGALVGVYTGEPTDIDGTYVLWVEGDEGAWLGVDGTGVLRFLNHSRTPNVEFDGDRLYTLRDIAVGEELFFDYGEEWAEVP